MSDGSANTQDGPPEGSGHSEQSRAQQGKSTAGASPKVGGGMWVTTSSLFTTRHACGTSLLISLAKALLPTRGEP